MHAHADKQPTGFLLRFRKQDTPTGVSIETIERLAEVTGLTKTEVVHFALRELANKFLPAYEPDDADLSDTQLDAIRAASSASGLSDQAFTERLF